MYNPSDHRPSIEAEYPYIVCESAFLIRTHDRSPITREECATFTAQNLNLLPQLLFQTQI